MIIGRYVTPLKESRFLANLVRAKQAGSGRMLALSMIEKGYGGLVICVKPDEVYTWLEYAKEIDHLDRIRVFGDPLRLTKHKARYLDLEVSLRAFQSLHL